MGELSVFYSGKSDSPMNDDISATVWKKKSRLINLDKFYND